VLLATPAAAQVVDFGKYPDLKSRSGKFLSRVSRM
jgi:hypothetical protein